ncbi:hypothetical protein NAEGRDRAFT_57330 [Naegleria gruberi]|uniref:Uncharacterized protein n=1 Tax=Naegleria gruberi TaxID=5762 RepID=D2V6Y2_NAEGR|nr:uncharacterized protein NAEGRDRAFT_57330 [Naegleria gruberi]EFC47528.1 hypothetical protein NAEGRDRAFT_57330 [Naegleria gruberi]|eukprot:XP_002680272.1 hypothetical protein NAEGRDRAFT_57330 [Naegleria gruberi strain NEG-M]
MSKHNTWGGSSPSLSSTTKLIVGLFVLLLIVQTTIGSTLNLSSTRIDTTLNTTQIEFRPLDPSAPSSIPNYNVGTQVSLSFSFFSIEHCSFDIVVVSKHSKKEYSTNGGIYQYNTNGTIEEKELKITIPTEIDTAEGAYVFRLKKKVEKVSQELNFDSPEFTVTVNVDNTSLSWPTIVLILFFPPALLLVAVVGGCVMCKRQRRVQQQELEQHDYEQQLDDDVDINFDHDDEEENHHRHHHTSKHHQTNKKKEEPKMAFVLEDDDDDEPMSSSHIHIDDDDENERRGNFYYTKNI